MSETTLAKADKAYTFRPLEASDVFLMSKIIGAIGVNEFSACFDGDAIRNMIADVKKVGNDSAAIVGVSVFLKVADVLFKNLPKCENDIYKMLANVSGMTEQEVKKLDFVTFTEMIIEFVQKEEFRDFIKVVSRLFK